MTAKIGNHTEYIVARSHQRVYVTK